MKIPLLPLLLLALLPITLTSNSEAQTSVTSEPSANGAVPQLEKAFTTLSQADHDYQGHRARAMGHIKAAIRFLGSSDSDKDAHVRESQAASDDQLNEAEAILQQVQAQVSGKALSHVQKAIEEIKIALSIR